MSLGRSLLALGALGSALSLSGCVAVVIPLAAGTLMATSAKTSGGTRANDTVAADAAPPPIVIVAAPPPCTEPANCRSALIRASTMAVTSAAMSMNGYSAPMKPS